MQTGMIKLLFIAKANSRSYIMKNHYNFSKPAL